MAVRNALTMTQMMGYQSVALPAVSSGIFGFPKSILAENIIDEIVKYAEDKRISSDKKIVSDIRLTNWDDATCEFFVADFDLRKFDSEGNQTAINDTID